MAAASYGQEDTNEDAVPLCRSQGAGQRERERDVYQHFANCLDSVVNSRPLIYSTHTHTHIAVRMYWVFPRFSEKAPNTKLSVNDGNYWTVPFPPPLKELLGLPYLRLLSWGFARTPASSLLDPAFSGPPLSPPPSSLLEPTGELTSAKSDRSGWAGCWSSKTSWALLPVRKIQE